MNDVNTIPSVLRLQAERRADHPFLVCDSQVLTYSDASARSALLAKGLIGGGAAKGTRIAIIYPNGPAFAVAALAAARIGAVVAPVSTFSTSTEIGRILVNAGADWLISADVYRNNDFVDRVSEALPQLDLQGGPPLLSGSVPALRRIAFDTEDDRVGPDWTLDALLRAGTTVDDRLLHACQESVTAADRLVIIHTSGSTSDPKGVIHTQGSLIQHQRNLNHLRRFEEHEVLFCNSPFFWVGGYAYALLATLIAGGTLVCSNAADASGVLDVIERTRPTMVNGFAAQVAHLPVDPSFAGRELSSIRRGNLYPIMTDDVRPTDPELRHNMLGTTETGSVCLADEDESDQPESRRGSFGRPVPGIEGRIMDPDTGRLAPPGQVGELHLRGPAMMEGYCGRERHQTFDRDGWYHTGDLFTRDGDGLYYFKGRAGDMIKTSGANVSPREVEAAVLAEAGLVAHVVGLDDPAAGQVVAAAIRVPPGTVAPDPAQLQSSLRQRLSAYKVPKVIVLMAEDEVPVMSSGKLDIRALKERFRAR